MDPKKILELANEFYKIAGVFSGPPVMQEVITKWALSAFASQVWLAAKKRLETVADKEKDDFIKLMLVESNLVISACKQYTNKPASRLTRSSGFAFPLDHVSEWKYLTPLQQKYGVKFLIDQKGWPASIKVNFIFSLLAKPKNLTEDNWEALWLPDKKEIYLFAVTNITNMESFNRAIQKIKSEVRHEVQHLGQWALKDIKDLNVYPGIPSKDLRDRSVDVHGNPTFPGPGQSEKRIDHTRRDIEFYTNLRDSISNFKAVVDKEKDPVAFAKFWIGQNPTYKSHTTAKPDYFFSSLKRNDPAKWRKAVIELYKNI